MLATTSRPPARAQRKVLTQEDVERIFPKVIDVKLLKIDEACNACLLDFEVAEEPSPPEILPRRCDASRGEDAPSMTIISRLDGCGHVFHAECARKWAAKENTCPQCKERFVKIGCYVSDGRRIDVHSVADRRLVETLQREEEDESGDDSVCRLCRAAGAAALLLCDGDGGNCNAPYHYFCVGLDSVPPGHWFCPECVRLGRTHTAPGATSGIPSRSRSRRPALRARGKAKARPRSAGPRDGIGRGGRVAAGRVYRGGRLPVARSSFVRDGNMRTLGAEQLFARTDPIVQALDDLSPIAVTLDDGVSPSAAGSPQQSAEQLSSDDDEGDDGEFMEPIGIQLDPAPVMPTTTTATTSIIGPISSGETAQSNGNHRRANSGFLGLQPQGDVALPPPRPPGRHFASAIPFGRRARAWTPPPAHGMDQAEGWDSIYARTPPPVRGLPDDTLASEEFEKRLFEMQTAGSPNRGEASKSCGLLDDLLGAPSDGLRRRRRRPNGESAGGAEQQQTTATAKSNLGVRLPEAAASEGGARGCRGGAGGRDGDRRVPLLRVRVPLRCEEKEEGEVGAPGGSDCGENSAGGRHSGNPGSGERKGDARGRGGGGGRGRLMRESSGQHDGDGIGRTEFLDDWYNEMQESLVTNSSGSPSLEGLSSSSSSSSLQGARCLDSSPPTHPTLPNEWHCGSGREKRRCIEAKVGTGSSGGGSAGEGRDKAEANDRRRAPIKPTEKLVTLVRRAMKRLNFRRDLLQADETKWKEVFREALRKICQRVVEKYSDVLRGKDVAMQDAFWGSEAFLQKVDDFISRYCDPRTED